MTITIRILKSPAEFAQAQEVARAAWKFSDLELPPVADLQMIGHIGGFTAGAFENGAMLGFVHGVPRTNLREPCQHSHLLAVVPAARGRSLASKLKFYQRDWCLKRGIKLVTWTYDPLLVRNAHLNLVRLGGRARTYINDFYGPMGGIYGNLPTDRFEVHWRLTDPAVRAAAKRKPEDPADAESLPAFTGGRPKGRRVTVDVPADALGLYAADAAAAMHERLRFRKLATALFKAGFAAVSVKPGVTRALYVFERS